MQLTENEIVFYKQNFIKLILFYLYIKRHEILTKDPGFTVYSKHEDAEATIFTTNNSIKNLEVQSLNFSSKNVNTIKPSLSVQL